MTDHFGQREGVLLTSYCLLLSIHLFFLFIGVLTATFAARGAIVCGIFLLIVVTEQFAREPAHRVGRSAFLLFMSLLGLLILMDLVLILTDGEPFSHTRL